MTKFIVNSDYRENQGVSVTLPIIFVPQWCTGDEAETRKLV